jgi:hypothetical protein
MYITKIEKFDKAIAQFFISLRFNEARKDSAFISSDYNNIGTILKSKLDFFRGPNLFGKSHENKDRTGRLGWYCRDL